MQIVEREGFTLPTGGGSRKQGGQQLPRAMRVALTLEDVRDDDEAAGSGSGSGGGSGDESVYASPRGGGREFDA